MTNEQALLWAKIQAFELDDSENSLTFTDRLARENGWSLELSLRTIREYKKFIFLICISNEPITPSDQVDQVWHLHLLYTQSYWMEFCRDTLGKQIHHGPTKGGKKETSKYTDWYEKTLHLYETIFHQLPPKDIWPDKQTRFEHIHYELVNKHTHWIIKKPSFFKK